MADVFVFDETDQIFHRLVEGTMGADVLRGLYDPLTVHLGGYQAPGIYDTHDELFRGFRGDDRIFAGDGEDVVYGSLGKDTINSGIGIDFLFGGSGNDVLTDPDPGVQMDGGVANDVMRCLIIGKGPGQFLGSTLHGGEGADQFHVNATRLTNIDDVNFGEPHSVVIDDFHRSQGDKIELHGSLEGGAARTGQALFARLDTNHDHKLSEADGSTSLGRVTWDGESTDSDTQITTVGALHLRLGQTEIVVEHTDHLAASDFMF